MKKLIRFNNLILASLFLLPTLLSCNDNEIESHTSYGTLPTKFANIKTWFSENSTTIPTPTATTRVEIEQGNQVENDHGIGAHFYDIDIADYFINGVEYDVEFFLNSEIEIIAVVVNDVLVGTSDDTKYSIAKAKLMEEYKAYTIGNITWSTQRTYQVAKFNITTKAESKSITAWYSVSGNTATREMDSEDLGTTIPDIIKEAFASTPYSNSELWSLTDVELEQNYNSNGIKSYYEVELINKANSQLEAELLFNATTGALLASKEELDNSDDDSDDDKFVVNADFKAAVELAVPGATIIGATIDDNVIEVDAITTLNGVIKEVELEFTLRYEFLSSESEIKYTYNQLPSNFSTINSWFINNPTIAPIPNAGTVVEITEGIQIDDDYNIGTYYYEVEIDDYISGGNEYEIEFYLDKNSSIICVIVNDIKQATV